MSKILIAFASRHGHTARIVDRIASDLRAAGHRVTVVENVAAVDPTPRDFDAVIAGASIHGGAYQHEMIAWALRHAIALNAVPSAFFSVCLTIADDDDEARAAAADYLDEFEELTGWTPRIRTTFAGALQYRRYDFLTRLLMRVLMKRAGRPTDPSRDYDYTDWDAVDAFARDCAAAATADPTAVAR